MEEGAVIKHDIKKAPKTGEWGINFPKVDKRKCLGCGMCVPYCPEAVIELSVTEKKTAQIDYAFCKGCGVCASVCPAKAILMTKKS